VFSLGRVLLEMATAANRSLTTFEEYRITNGLQAYAAYLPKVYGWILHEYNSTTKEAGISIHTGFQKSLHSWISFLNGGLEHRIF
jgi:hypothetical protein